MIHHLDLGNNSPERRKKLAALIRSGAVTMGGYKKARIYGLLRCSSGKSMQPANRVFFRHEAEALANGYRPCGNCLPEKYKKWKAGLDGNSYSHG
ncbi:MAG TPA: Ada metal-binding domain-containing protein [Chitinophaga sp.]